MITRTIHAGPSARFARMAAYVGHLFEDVTKLMRSNRTISNAHTWLAAVSIGRTSSVN